MNDECQYFSTILFFFNQIQQTEFYHHPEPESTLGRAELVDEGEVIACFLY